VSALALLCDECNRKSCRGVRGGPAVEQLFSTWGTTLTALDPRGREGRCGVANAGRLV